MRRAQAQADAGTYVLQKRQGTWLVISFTERRAKRAAVREVKRLGTLLAGMLALACV